MAGSANCCCTAINSDGFFKQGIPDGFVCAGPNTIVEQRIRDSLTETGRVLSYFFVKRAVRSVNIADNINVKIHRAH
jgi:hypothetical protein